MTWTVNFTSSSVRWDRMARGDWSWVLFPTLWNIRASWSWVSSCLTWVRFSFSPSRLGSGKMVSLEGQVLLRTECSGTFQSGFFSLTLPGARVHSSIFTAGICSTSLGKNHKVGGPSDGRIPLEFLILRLVLIEPLEICRLVSFPYPNSAYCRNCCSG